MISEDRLMVIKAVFQGQIGEEHISQAEVDEFMEIVCKVATEQLMVEAISRGLTVFDGVAGNTLQ